MNPSRRTERPDPIQEQLEILKMLRESGVSPDAYLNAHIVERPGFELPRLAKQHVLQQAILNRVRPPAPPPVATGDVLTFGDVPIATDSAALGILITGATGTGKTTLILHLTDQCLKKGIHTRFWDAKGEARRFHQFWPEAMVFDPTTAPWQWLEPPRGCDPLTNFMGVISEVRNELELRPETYPLAYSLFERMLRSMRPGDPYPSISDFRRVCEHEAAAQHRENLFTLARAFLNLETIMGPNARVRKAPDVTRRYRLMAFDFVGHDIAILRLFLGLHLNRLLLQAHNEEHTSGLRTLEIIDEAANICGIELMRRPGANLSSVKRFASQARFTGTGLILGAQNISLLDPFAKNAGTVGVFRPPSVDDAEDAAKLLGLPRDAVPDLLRLDVREAYLRSVGWQQPVRIKVDVFPS